MERKRIPSETPEGARGRKEKIPRGVGTEAWEKRTCAGQERSNDFGGRAKKTEDDETSWRLKTKKSNRRVSYKWVSATKKVKVA